MKKRRKKKKITSILLAGVMCLGTIMLSACSAAGQYEEKPPEVMLESPPEYATAKVMTLNVAYYDGDDTDGQHLDDLAYEGQSLKSYTFEERADRFKSLLDYYQPEVFFLNEFNYEWWKLVISNEDSIIAKLPQYTFVEAKSTGTSENGEGTALRDLYNMLFYNKEKFTLVDSGNFVMCETWDGWYDRCTWAKLRDNETGKEAVYASVHMTTIANLSRAVLSLDATITAAETLSEIANGLPIIMGGDFNTTEDAKLSSHTYKYMTEYAGYKDARYAAPRSDESGTARIWGKALENNGNRIDYIFTQGVSVKEYEVAAGAFLEDDTYVPEVSSEELTHGEYFDISDHLPVVTTLILKDGQSVAPKEYSNEIGKDDVASTPTGTYKEQGGTSTKIIFDFNNALEYVGNINKNAMEASLVKDEEMGNVLKLTATENTTRPYISIDYLKLMKDNGLSILNVNDLPNMKITYRVESSWNYKATPVRVGLLGEKLSLLDTQTSLPLKKSGTWYTQTIDFSIHAAMVQGKVSGIGFYSGDGLLRGDSIYISSIEFVE